MEGIERNSICLRVRDRGFEVYYNENSKRPGAGMYDNVCCEWKTESYGEKELPKAMKRVEELIALGSEEDDD